MTNLKAISFNLYFVTCTYVTLLSIIDNSVESVHPVQHGVRAVQSNVHAVQQNVPVWNFHIARKIMSSFEYHGRDVAIWEDKETETLPMTQRQFYVTPAAELIPSSAKCEYRALTSTYKALFDIQLWNRHLDLATVENLKKFQINVDSNQVHPLPFYQLRVMWKDLDKPKDFSIDNNWINNLQQHYVHRFLISARTKTACEMVVDIIKNQSNQFAESINLEYTLTASSVATKVMNIKLEHVTSSSLYASLNNMDTDNGIRYLKGTDLNSLGSEIVWNVVASEITSGDFVRDADQVSLKDLITRTLDAQKLKVGNFTDQIWRSVYWNPDYARPDKVCSYLNKVLKIDKSGNRAYRKNETSSSEGGGISIGPINLTAQVQGTSSDSYTLDDIHTWLRQNDYQVEIKGEMFVPKNVELFRLNLTSLQSRDVITTKLVQIQGMEATGSLKVTVGKADSFEEENNLLRQKLAKLEQDVDISFNTTESNIDAIKSNLEQMKADWKNAKIESNSSVSTLQNELNVLQSRAVSACRVCISGVGHSECTKMSRSCSEWSTSPQSSPGYFPLVNTGIFDRRVYHCGYSLMLECRV